MSYGEFRESKGFDQPGLGNSTAPTAERIELVLVSVVYPQHIADRSV